MAEPAHALTYASEHLTPKLLEQVKAALAPPKKPKSPGM